VVAAKKVVPERIMAAAGLERDFGGCAKQQRIRRRKRPSPLILKAGPAALTEGLDAILKAVVDPRQQQDNYHTSSEGARLSGRASKDGSERNGRPSRRRARCAAPKADGGVTWRG